MTHEATTAPTSEVEYHGILTDPTFRRYTAAERLGAKLGELTVYALLVVGAWTLLKWLATAIVAMDAHEDCVRLSRQADYGYIDQAAVPQYCDALLSP
jgi:hypothetical protein